MSQEVDSINLLGRATHPKLDKGLYFKDLKNLSDSAGRF